MGALSMRLNMQIDDQVWYLDNWVSRHHFRAFVYNSNGQKIAESYQEFSDLIASGIWFAKKEDVPSKDTDNVIDIKPKRGRKCHSQQKA